RIFCSKLKSRQPLSAYAEFVCGFPERIRGFCGRPYELGGEIESQYLDGSLGCIPEVLHFLLDGFKIAINFVDLARIGQQIESLLGRTAEVLHSLSDCLKVAVNLVELLRELDGRCLEVDADRTGVSDCHSFCAAFRYGGVAFAIASVAPYLRRDRSPAASTRARPSVEVPRSLRWMR